MGLWLSCLLISLTYWILISKIKFQHLWYYTTLRVELNYEEKQHLMHRSNHLQYRFIHILGKNCSGSDPDSAHMGYNLDPYKGKIFIDDVLSLDTHGSQEVVDHTHKWWQLIRQHLPVCRLGPQVSAGWVRSWLYYQELLPRLIAT